MSEAVWPCASRACASDRLGSPPPHLTFEALLEGIRGLKKAFYLPVCCKGHRGKGTRGEVPRGPRAGAPVHVALGRVASLARGISPSPFFMAGPSRRLVD